MYVYDRTEVKLLCEDVQLGTPFVDSWCHPRPFPNTMPRINNIEDLDEDKTDLLGVYVRVCVCHIGMYIKPVCAYSFSTNDNLQLLFVAISDLLPDLLKFSPNSSLDTPRERSQLSDPLESGRRSTKQPSQSDTARGVLVTQKPLWQQSSSTSTGHTSGNALLHDKGHLLNTELALSRTIRNYHHKRHRSPVGTQNGEGVNTLVHPSSYKAKKQGAKTTRRPQSGVVHKKSSMSHKTPKVRPLSAAQVTNTNTAKDLELLTKTLCRQLSIKGDLQ